MSEITDFPASAPAAEAVFYRTYSRKGSMGRESWREVVERNLRGLTAIGKLTTQEQALLRTMQLEQMALPSGRWLWVGGTNWIERPENFSGAYNCSSTNLIDWEAFALMMDLAMMGCGTGAVIEPWLIKRLPKIRNKIVIEEVTDVGTVSQDRRLCLTSKFLDRPRSTAVITVGDSRHGWVDAYRTLLKLSTDEAVGAEPIRVTIDLSHVRPAGEPLMGFGGVANPVKLQDLFGRLAAILNRAHGRQLTPVECCLLIDEAALVVVAGNIRRSAGMRQFNAKDQAAATAKDDLWEQDGEGGWRIDPERDALRMANHTRVFHSKPSKADVLASVRKQFHSGEGAIQYAPEAVARSNADLLDTAGRKQDFINAYCRGQLEGQIYLDRLGDFQESREQIEHRVGRYGLNPCFAAGTIVLTRDGHFPIEALVGRTVEVHDGSEWVTINSFRVTGTNQPVHNVELNNGQVLTVTGPHKFILEDGTRVKATELCGGMRLAPAVVTVEGTAHAKAAYLKGFLVGDGTRNRESGIPACKVYESKRACLDRLVESQKEMKMKEMVRANGKVVGDSYGLTDAGYLRNLNHPESDWMLPWCSVYKHEFPFEVLNWTRKCQCDFIAGLFDANGTAMDAANGFAYQITSISRKFLEGLGLLLTQLGVRWKIGPVRKGGQRDFGAERGGVYTVKDNYKLAIPQGSSIALAKMVTFARLKSFADRKTAYKTKDNSYVVSKVTFSHIAEEVYCCTVPGSHSFTLTCGIVSAQCGEISGQDFHCNLAEVHLNRLDPHSSSEQVSAFKAATLSAAALLHHRFEVERFRKSREWDPIVGVSFTGLFDFFVKDLGVDWLKWFVAGRPDSSEGDAFREAEAARLHFWREIVKNALYDYCTKHGLKMPNRYTTVQPAGTKSLLTNASPGWHPPKAQRFIRRITFRRDDPVALACLDQGFSIVPSQSDKDEQGRLLDDPFDPRCTEWLVEIPTEVPWANLPGADEVDLSQISALAQFDFYMQVQTHYTTHNTSATIEFREHEIEPLATAIHDAIAKDRGYISAALLARFDANETFPRLPFEPIDKATFERLQGEVEGRRQPGSFYEALQRHDGGQSLAEVGPAGCDSDKCLMPQAKP